MGNIPRPVEEIISRVSISDVWHELGGGEIRRGRARAFWREGDGWNVSLCDTKSTWFDHRDGGGGGVLDLVVKIRGGSRADALRWCADLAGVQLDDRPLPPEDRARWAAERRAMEKDLPDACHWRRTAVLLCDEKLVMLKAALFDPTADAPELGEIAWWTRERARLSRLDGAGLVEVYREAMKREPAVTAGIVRWAKNRELVEIRALLRYLGEEAVTV